MYVVVKIKKKEKKNKKGGLVFKAFNSIHIDLIP